MKELIKTIYIKINQLYNKATGKYNIHNKEYTLDTDNLTDNMLDNEIDEKILNNEILNDEELSILFNKGDNRYLQELRKKNAHLPIEEQLEIEEDIMDGTYSVKDTITPEDMIVFDDLVKNEDSKGIEDFIKRRTELWPHRDADSALKHSVVFKDDQDIKDNIKFYLYERHPGALSTKDTGYKESFTIQEGGQLKEEESKSTIKILDYILLFKKYINSDNFFKKEKVEILKKMYEDAILLADILEPLNELSIRYTIDITGGSVRDFVLNNHLKIKDLDFMVSIDDKYLDIKTEEMLLSSKVFTEEDLDNIEWSDADFPVIKKINIVQMLLNKANVVNKTYSLKHKLKTGSLDENVEILDYGKPTGEFYKKSSEQLERENRLLSVNKLSNKAHDGIFNYDIDVMLTGYHKVDFLTDFDFNICKASMCIVNDNVRIKKPTHYMHLLRRFNASMSFWGDVANKTLTCETISSTNSVMSSFKNRPDKKSHYERLKEKFPDHNLVIYKSKSDMYTKTLLSDIEKELTYNVLEKETQNTIKPSTKKKVKI